MTEQPRPGQIEALNVIIARWKQRQSYVSVVAPTRYGKSDLIRAATLVGVQYDLISCSLVLSPTGFLAKQMVNAEKWQNCLRRFNNVWLEEAGYPPITFQPIYARLKGAMARPNVNGEHLLSATIQLIERNIDIFSGWVESVLHTTGRPVAIFMDESHTGSESNKWGGALEQLATSGARVVLLTATAERSDGKRIPGFNFEELDTEATTVTVPTRGSSPELVKVNVYKGVERRLRLTADVEIPFEQAFGENALAQVSYTPIDIDLNEVAKSSYTGMLSALPASKVPAALDQLTRDPAVIAAGVRELVTSLRLYRKVQLKTTAIIFCGNDVERHGAQRGDNQHPEMVRDELLRQAPEFVASIFTADDEGAEDRLADFCEGRSGDVAIVKQMASLGLDSSLLKVGLDLSTTRTFAASAQRMMRVATPLPLVAHWISPDDILARANFKRLVTDQRGEATSSDLELVYSYEIQRKDDKPVKDVWRVDGASPSDFDDSRHNHGTRDQYPDVQRYYAIFPAMRSEYTEAYIAEGLRALNVEAHTQGQEVKARDTGAEAEALRIEINQIARQAEKDLVKKRGLVFGTFDWGVIAREIDAAAFVGLNRMRDEKRSEMTDVHRLTMLRDNMKAVHARIHEGDGEL